MDQCVKLAAKEALEKIGDKHDRLLDLSFGIEALGHMLFQHDRDAGFGDDTREKLGYFMGQIGAIMAETVNDAVSLQNTVEDTIGRLER